MLHSNLALQEEKSRKTLRSKFEEKMSLGRKNYDIELTERYLGTSVFWLKTLFRDRSMLDLTSLLTNHGQKYFTTKNDVNRKLEFTWVCMLHEKPTSVVLSDPRLCCNISKMQRWIILEAKSKFPWVTCENRKQLSHAKVLHAAL